MCNVGSSVGRNDGGGDVCSSSIEHEVLVDSARIVLVMIVKVLI